jgi:hypothetical protein
MDALVAAAYHNFNCSPLCSLPEDLLVQIMQHLNPLSMQCLRRVSRLFLRLYCSPEFADTHDITHFEAWKVHHMYSDCWYQPLLDYVSDKHSLGVSVNRDLDEYCADCREMRRSRAYEPRLNWLTMEYLHCSKCEVDHPICLFSPTQRKVRAKERMCIGREGFVRLCRHEVVSWDQVFRHARELKKIDINGDFADVTIGPIRCYDLDHLPQHHGEWSKFVDEWAQPGFFVEGQSVGRVAVFLCWTGHLHLPEANTKNGRCHNQMTPKELRHHLEWFRRGSAAESIVPELPPGRLVEMNCFDPSRCRCLRLSGEEELPSGWCQTLDDPDVHDIATLNVLTNQEAVFVSW